VAALNCDGFRFHGYLRSGFGVTGDGKPMEPFMAPNADAKYRLGNEAEAYLETTFNYGQTLSPVVGGLRRPRGADRLRRRAARLHGGRPARNLVENGARPAARRLPG
jgi:hypothetical protein